MNEKDVTPALKSAVSAYLMARAYTETMRERVDKIQRAVLEECPLTCSDQWSPHETSPIVEPDRIFLCDDDAQLADYYSEIDKREREEGLKPADMPESHCPALVAEEITRKAERLIVECAAEMLKESKITVDNLLCLGLDEYHKFIDLCCGLVVSLPDFKNPMGKVAA